MGRGEGEGGRIRKEGEGGRGYGQEQVGGERQRREGGKEGEAGR